MSLGQRRRPSLGTARVDGLPARPILRARADAWLLVGIAIVALAVRMVPVLAGGGLTGLRGYDDGVYFGMAMALVHGVVPYRDVLLLQPPGITLLLAPFAMLGSIVGDASAFALGRASFMLLGAGNAVLAALIAGRYGRSAGLAAGAFYAVWNTTSFMERSTDLHVPQSTLLLLALLVLARPGRIGPPRAAIVGAVLGLAATVQAWQVVSIAILLWWIAGHTSDGRRHQLRTIGAYVIGAGLAILLVCLPFFLAAPEVMIRQTLIDQIGRPDTGVGLIRRLWVLEGFPTTAPIGALLRQWLPNAFALVIAAGGLAIVLLTARRQVWARPWAALAVGQSIVVLSTPSFFADYPGFMAPAATLVIGTAAAAGATRLTRRGLGPRLAALPIVGILAVLMAVSIIQLEGRPLPIADLERHIADARCVTSDAPTILIVTSALRADLQAGCQVLLDPTGIAYDADRGRLLPGDTVAARRQATGYQRAMADWYTSGDAALFASLPSDGLSPATEATIRRLLPVERREGIVTVRLAAGPP
jgi:hypothetical protein